MVHLTLAGLLLDSVLALLEGQHPLEDFLQQRQALRRAGGLYLADDLAQRPTLAGASGRSPTPLGREAVRSCFGGQCAALCAVLLGELP